MIYTKSYRNKKPIAKKTKNFKVYEDILAALGAWFKYHFTLDISVASFCSNYNIYKKANSGTMAKESIDTIISQEALEQFIELGRRLDNVYVKMESLIGKVFDLNKAMSGASGVKEAAQAMNEQSKAADELNKTNSERLNVERKIKEEGAKMAQQVKERQITLKNLPRSWKNTQKHKDKRHKLKLKCIKGKR